MINCEDEIEVEVDSEGIKLYKSEKAPLSGTEKKLEIDRKGWVDGQIELCMTVNSIKANINEENGKTLKKLILRVSEIGQKPKDEFWAIVEEELGIVKTGSKIKLNGDKPAKNNLIDLVKFLVDNGKLTKSDLPVSSGYKRYLLNTDPVDKKGGKMSSEVKIDEGIFLETKHSRNNIREKIRELGEKFGKR